MYSPCPLVCVCVCVYRVVGHGMNAAELARNPQLDEFFVRNLNTDPKFAAADNSFDAVVCCVRRVALCVDIWASHACRH